MENVSKKPRFDEKVAGRCRAEDRYPSVKCPPFQPQASRFDKIDSSDFLAFAEQRLIASERTSFKRLVR